MAWGKFQSAFYHVVGVVEALFVGNVGAEFVHHVRFGGVDVVLRDKLVHFAIHKLVVGQAEVVAESNFRRTYVVWLENYLADFAKVLLLHLGGVHTTALAYGKGC